MKGELSKESLNDILQTLEMHPSGHVYEILLDY